jgi:hypothetical protein
MQLGERKCLILVGLRQSNWDADDRVLVQEDVELIDLVPVTESNGEVVFRQLEAAAKTGIPRAIVSDGGPDLHRGIARFCQKHPTTAWLYDIKHKTACLLKHALEGDVSWHVFVDVLVDWAEKTLRLLDRPKAMRKESGCWDRARFWSRSSVSSKTWRASGASTG